MSGGMMVAVSGEWIKWAWVYGTADMSEHDSYEEAIAAAVWAADEGQESFDCIEGPDGVVVPREKMADDMSAYSAAEWKRQKRERDVRPLTHGVKVRHPDGKQEAWEGSYYDEASAEAAAAKLRPRFGDRVRVVRLG